MKKNVMKKMVLLLCLAFMMCVVAGCGGEATGDQPGVTDEPGATSGDVIKLGYLGAKTGAVANYGIPAEKGMIMAIEEINAAGGVLGMQLEGIYEDNKGETSEIATITQKYITRDKVAALVGDPCTGLTIAAAKIAQDNEIVLFSGGATGTGVVEVGDYIFRNTLLDAYAGPIVVDWMINEQGWTDVAVITSMNNGYSTALTPVFVDAINAAGGNIVIEESVNDGDIDYTAQVTNIKNADPDVIVFTGYYTEAALIMAEVQKKGMDINMIGGDGLYGLDLGKLGGSAVENKVMFYCGFSSDTPSPETAAFIEAYRARWNEDPDMFSAQYYDAVNILAYAMTEANSADPKVFKDYIATLDNYPGVSGATTIDSETREPRKGTVFLQTPVQNPEALEGWEFKLVEAIEVEV
ncbi:MAG: ABC transporter substrate-binding protein [Syntrophomonadaceae bacterium]|nr:ABC transporter substrate-binding protein [Syntrophomonadaceae bacterium]